MILTRDLRQGFKSYITGRSGLYFKDHDLKNLEDAVFDRMKALSMSSVPAYYAYLTSSLKKEDEFRELLNILTIQHTYFFRNEPQFNVLRDKVLPELIRDKRKGVRGKVEKKPSLRIWSAGCSMGQEPYTIAMAIIDALGEDIDNWDIHILATDASEEAIRIAQKGVYNVNSMKNVDEVHREKCFNKAKGKATEGSPERSRGRVRGKDEYELKSSVKKLVSFAYFNLMDEDYPAGFDVIFCRNVVIYFELGTTMKVMNKFYSSLLDSGCIFIGYSETLQFMQEKFKMMSGDDAIYYRKRLKSITLEPEIKPEPRQAKEEIDVDKFLEEISRREAIAELESAPKKEAPLEKFEDILVQIIKSIHLKEYDKALGLIKSAIRTEKNSADPYYLAAEIFVNQGRPDQAKDRLKKALEIDSFFAPA
ncbi:MAG: tetratricopeptide repeat protein, partial [Candidatus Omnitrophica bacterium]|nr:tetratricopeptide repeat protein [Candidatus Omnitrophota bacterium]